MSGITPVHLQAGEHAFAVHGLVALYRDVADAMQKVAEEDRDVCTGELSMWILKLDTLTNALSDRGDDLSEELRREGFNAPLSWGSFVGRGDA